MHYVSTSPLQIFSNEGEFKSRFGVRGRSPGQLQRPTGVAVHPSGDIIIADYDNKWVSIFSCEGKFKVGASMWVGAFERWRLPFEDIFTLVDFLMHENKLLTGSY